MVLEIERNYDRNVSFIPEKPANNVICIPQCFYAIMGRIIVSQLGTHKPSFVSRKQTKNLSLDSRVWKIDFETR